MRNITSKNIKHIPVLIDSVLNGLSIKKNGIYIDATFGRGGHSREILSLLGKKGKLIAIEKKVIELIEKDPKNCFPISYLDIFFAFQQKVQNHVSCLAVLE